MLLDHAEQTRHDVSPSLNEQRKSSLGQFMTPATVARFMASMFPPSTQKVCKLLDAGAGLGALTCAFADRWRNGGFDFSRMEVTAYELDDTLRQHLATTLAKYADSGRFVPEVVAGDFIIQMTAALLKPGAKGRFSHAILNPPYKKINSNSAHRHALRQVGIETVNLYAAFVALAVELMAQGGYLVAIIPRSFCNGTYYRQFRELLLTKTAIRAMHLFDSRSKAFKDDAVLQENIIIVLERGGVQGAVKVTTSTDDRFADLVTHEHPSERIIFPDDDQRFIHVPTATGETELEQSEVARFALDEIGVKVSTGPVVDFRLRDHLRGNPEDGSVPLLYPGHFSGLRTIWPVLGGKKPNAIMQHDETKTWLMPIGFYCVVRRFSSKEERRRIVASVVRPDDFPRGTTALGLENHLNVFNERRHGIPELLAYGLAIYLNTTAVDEAFRRFNGHTQVNAGDLKTMRYPSREVLMALGRWAIQNPDADQLAIDDHFRRLR